MVISCNCVVLSAVVSYSVIFKKRNSLTGACALAMFRSRQKKMSADFALTRICEPEVANAHDRALLVLSIATWEYVYEHTPCFFSFYTLAIFQNRFHIRANEPLSSFPAKYGSKCLTAFSWNFRRKYGRKHANIDRVVHHHPLCAVLHYLYSIAHGFTLSSIWLFCHTHSQKTSWTLPWKRYSWRRKLFLTGGSEVVMSRQ